MVTVSGQIIITKNNFSHSLMDVFMGGVGVGGGGGAGASFTRRNLLPH